MNWERDRVRKWVSAEREKKKQTNISLDVKRSLSDNWMNDYIIDSSDDVRVDHREILFFFFIFQFTIEACH